MNSTKYLLISFMIFLPSLVQSKEAQFSISQISNLPPIGQRIANKVVHRLKKKKFSPKKINSELNLILTSIEKSSKYHFMKIARECAKDSFTYCNQNLSEKELKKISQSGLQFTVTMECVKKNYLKYSKLCKDTLIKNEVVQKVN